MGKAGAGGGGGGGDESEIYFFYVLMWQWDTYYLRIYFIFIVISNVPSWILSPCVKEKSSFLCFVYWWIIKTYLIWFDLNNDDDHGPVTSCSFFHFNPNGRRSLAGGCSTSVWNIECCVWKLMLWVVWEARLCRRRVHLSSGLIVLLNHSAEMARFQRLKI